MIAYKIVRQLKDGSLAPLFINKKFRIPLDTWIEAEDHKTNGYAHRPGWHCTSEVNAPHLSKNGRVWVEVDIEDYQTIHRPERQGGIWFLANRIKFIRIV